MPFPGPLLSTMDEEVRPFAQPSRPGGLPYDFQWHGLMGYTNGRIRVVGAHPRHPELLYNLGCNGVGFLPSIAGGERIARLLAGAHLGPSIFDPRAGGTCLQAESTLGGRARDMPAPNVGQTVVAARGSRRPRRDRRPRS